MKRVNWKIIGGIILFVIFYILLSIAPIYPCKTGSGITTQEHIDSINYYTFCDHSMRFGPWVYYFGGIIGQQSIQIILSILITIGIIYGYTKIKNRKN